MKFTNRILTSDSICAVPDSWCMHSVIINREDACDYIKTIQNVDVSQIIEDFLDHRDWGYELYEDDGKYFVVDNTCSMFCEVESPYNVSSGIIDCIGDWQDIISNEEEV